MVVGTCTNKKKLYKVENLVGCEEKWVVLLLSKWLTKKSIFNNFLKFFYIVYGVIPLYINRLSNLIKKNIKLSNYFLFYFLFFIFYYFFFFSF
ncbi:hypothetical protein DDB_G0288855 [Dictyostelium discoideum AX4]|uniref:Uncharacterized protein n=1 Tax=Dictyostelium discoideum TaxID=44689 RepID=Q54IB6_DICDI|nr:hypothetical protein DDB_G0288855 [Dictyostelium discoideum AX4]EAL63049.1 hypothetical protein DDB_G0288855 [Dictyostelium discoideum AX4]|eukprot:XP_636561.1 hypothetical protein DDB_G0288855 [Dictyostelium discoideum AX4]